ncbi:hypothetical protein NUW58_g2482 [Xylaria curta]|uniref:Uncharacterized protein n=1 Tax=Xylaria curta TaxID=42375 RepID=A0ACC1PFA4_9PEZI|nr:hypothetical protein NUW58_g2482 [Xylaria curta]
MSEPLRETAPSGEREHSVETPCRQPAPVRTYYDQVRSLLGKREHGTSPTEAQPPARSNHHMVSDIDNSVTTGDTSDFAQYIENGESSIYMLDGTTDKINKRWGKPIAAIFIHAGAGYHSIANQEHHLKACSEAARVGMKVLKAGRSATEAVEAALKVLENKEITNAGYGSNLAIDGTVECDATVVDHFGRSGACGAVSNVKNPITLARVILESSNKPLSLRRVPPNLLVGEGARDFARDAGVELVANDDLISRNARDRFIRWRDDLRRAEGYDALMLPSNRNETTSQSEQDARKEHTNAILTGMWNEGQPDSPASGSPWTALQNLRSPISSPATTIMTPQVLPKPTPDRSPLSFLNSSLSLKRQRLLPAHSDEYVDNYAGDSSPTPGLSGDQMPNPIGSDVSFKKLQNQSATVPRIKTGSQTQ